MMKKDTGLLRKSIQKATGDGFIVFPDPRKLPRGGSGRPVMEQGHSDRPVRAYLRNISDEHCKKLAEEISKEATKRFL